MKKKLVLTVILFVGIFAVFITAVNAKSLSLFCIKKQNIVVTLKNEADINKSQEVFSKIPQVKIIKITDRDKEWSKMVNKMDLPNMENPFKNEFVLKTHRNADTNEIYKLIKEMSFVETVRYEQY